jgi:hypothetical protein
MSLDELVEECHVQQRKKGTINAKLFDMMLLRNAEKYGFKTWHEFLDSQYEEFKKIRKEWKDTLRDSTYVYCK